MPETSLRDPVSHAKLCVCPNGRHPAPDLNIRSAQPAVVTLLGFGFVGLWAMAGVLKGIESLPLAGTFFELVGLIFSGVRHVLWAQDWAASCFCLGE